MIGLRSMGCIGLLLLLGVWGGIALADDSLPGVRLIVDIPGTLPGCPNQEWIVERVRAESHMAPVPETPHPLTIAVRYSRDNGGFLARVDASGRREGLRELRASDCGGLSQAVVVTLAMLIDEESREREVTRALGIGTPALSLSASPLASASATLPTLAFPVPATSGSQPAVVQEKADIARPRVKQIGSDSATSPPLGLRAKPPLHPEIYARSWIGAGLSSETTASLFSGFELGRGPFSVRGAAWWRIPDSARLGAGRIRTLMLGGTFAGCGTALLGGSTSGLRPVACLQGWGGALQVEGQGYLMPQAQITRPWLGLGGSLGVETGRRWIVGLDLVALLPVVRDTFFSRAPEQRWSADPVAAWLVLRAGLSTHNPSPPATPGVPR